MYKLLVIFFILSIILLFSCNQNKEKLKLTLVETNNMSLFAEDTVAWTKGIRMNLNKYGELQAYYIDKRDTFIKLKNMVSGNIENIYSLSHYDYETTKQFTVSNDTIIYLLNDTLVLTTGKWKQKFNLPIDSIEFFTSRVRDYPHHFQNNRFYVGIGERNGHTFVGKYSDKIFSIDNDKVATIGYAGELPTKFDKKEFYLRSTLRVLGEQYIYYYPEKCDSVFIYDYEHLNLITKPISIFSDVKRFKDIPYDTSKKRDLVYIREYDQITERNMTTYQKQDSNQIYIIKRLPRKDSEEPVKHIIGKVKDNKYIGFATFPEDLSFFSYFVHFIHNNDLYIISTKEEQPIWYHYKIEEL